MTVREMRSGDEAAVIEMMRALWPDFDDEHIADEAVFVLEHAGALAGFVALSRRAYAPGCESSPVAFVEGWWVAPALRGQGGGRALIAAAEDWARAHGSAELASDALIDNTASHAAHAALGFDEIERVVCFRKRLA